MGPDKRKAIWVSIYQGLIVPSRHFFDSKKLVIGTNGLTGCAAVCIVGSKKVFMAHVSSGGNPTAENARQYLEDIINNKGLGKIEQIIIGYGTGARTSYYNSGGQQTAKAFFEACAKICPALKINLPEKGYNGGGCWVGMQVQDGKLAVLSQDTCPDTLEQLTSTRVKTLETLLEIEHHDPLNYGFGEPKFSPTMEPKKPAILSDEDKIKAEVFLKEQILSESSLDIVSLLYKQLEGSWPKTKEVMKTLLANLGNYENKEEMAKDVVIKICEDYGTELQELANDEIGYGKIAEKIVTPAITRVMEERERGQLTAPSPP